MRLLERCLLAAVPAIVIAMPALAASAWSPTTVYTGGEVVSYNGQDWRAKWWTQNNVPGADQWGPWELVTISATPTPTVTVTPSPTLKPTTTPTPTLKPTTTPTPTVSPTPTLKPTTTPTPTSTPTTGPTVTPTPVSGNCVPWLGSPAYTTGMCVIYNGNQYSAKWWNQNSAPTNDPYGPWTLIGPVTTPTPVVTVTPTPVITGTPTPIPTVVPARIGAVKVDTWRNGATAAYSMVHDDFCYSVVTQTQVAIADPELTKRGLVAGFGAITGQCLPTDWATAQTFIAHGHEIVDHSRSHPLGGSGDASWVNSVQISDSRQDIATNLGGYQATYFIWPNDTATDAAQAYLRSAPGYLGGRGTNRDLGGGNIEYIGAPVGINAANFTDPYMVKWDLFTISGQYSLYPMGSEILNLHVDAAIAQGGWATRTMHGVSDNATDGYEPVPVARYKAHLDYVKSKVDAGLLWVATPSSVIRYRFARDYCAPALSSNGGQVDFPATDANCVKYATPLSLEFTVAGNSVTLSQAGKVLTAKSLGNSVYRVDVLPTAGSVTAQAAQ
ncbi:Carbohydrate binding domain-containing protein [Andreprevotia lacus DSM 23236]|jgi:chitodextrinase|uniref:Carbohydrate binding domain-containing protein n=1 Tax=Andreprevotia lacus DSM 23236 TaxID=1121001 RepID=A0A1W1WWV1_9NEIS|nr:carbohydrate-binding protein [Andreprevotia lacus]SMC16199.1 Carbohydrate binding domain-containing protein [Andreprevotia lacus DSM 23236]